MCIYICSKQNLHSMLQTPILIELSESITTRILTMGSLDDMWTMWWLFICEMIKTLWWFFMIDIFISIVKNTRIIMISMIITIITLYCRGIMTMCASDKYKGRMLMCGYEDDYLRLVSKSWNLLKHLWHPKIRCHVVAWGKDPKRTS